MPSIRKSLLQLVFSGSYMKRWNDKLRPMELLEVDKQAHKMIVAWVLLVLNTRGMEHAERLAVGERVIEGGLFEYFYRLVITDIKPPIFYQIKSNPVHYAKLTEWVLEQLQPRLQSMGQEFWDKMVAYHAAPQNQQGTDLARRILDAAHLFASNYEFQLIRGLSPWDEEMREIEASFAAGMRAHCDLMGMDELMAGTSVLGGVAGNGGTAGAAGSGGSAGPSGAAGSGGSGATLGRFAHLCGRLRFQKRWSQTPRIPETSVLGHMFIVACYAYFFSMSVGACQARRQNNFFAGLFHDLPELLTRDIISPVKKSVQPIGDLIKEYEDREVKRRVLDVLEQGGYGDLAGQLAFFLGIEVGSEFTCCIRDGSGVLAVEWEDLDGKFNEDRFDPKDGRLLKVCDSLAAFIEAYTALRHGIASDQLQQAVWRLRTEYNNETLLGRVHIGALLADFD